MTTEPKEMRVLWLVCCGVGVLFVVIGLLSLYGEYRAGGGSAVIAGAGIALGSLFMYRRAAGKK